MDSDAASEAASSAAKSLDEKSSVASENPLMPERKWQRTHAWIQGLTMALLVRSLLVLTHCMHICGVAITGLPVLLL